MGFGKKTDPQSGRLLDLDKSYKNIIKPAAIAAGLDCVRADEIVHSGTIETPMYEQLLVADVVVADLSTSNCNAFYELGVRHALRPFTTITLAEDKMVIPFDVNHVMVRRYTHMGEGIDYDEVIRMQKELCSAIGIIAQKPTNDSPVYTFLSRLKPPMLEMGTAAAVSGAPSGTTASAIAASDQSATIVSLAMQAHQKTEEEAASGLDQGDTISRLMDDAQSAIDRSDFAAACEKLARVKQLAPRDPYVTQKLAMATYKRAKPTLIEALRAAESILRELATTDSTDTETLGLWGSIHKRLWDVGRNPADLETALAAHEKAFVIKKDYWNGINLAFLYNERAVITQNPQEAEADRVIANRTRRRVLEICEPLYSGASSAMARYWLLATIAEARVGLGEEAKAQQYLAEANRLNPAKWMLETTLNQLERLRKLLQDSPKP
jgi:tetratricopeptide (TPR) repeat protein